jgi:hypothetical protein
VSVSTSLAPLSPPYSKCTRLVGGSCNSSQIVFVLTQLTEEIEVSDSDEENEEEKGESKEEDSGSGLEPVEEDFSLSPMSLCSFFFSSFLHCFCSFIRMHNSNHTHMCLDVCFS